MSWSWMGWSVALGAGAWGGLRFLEWKNLYNPGSKVETTPKAFDLEYEDVVFVAEDGNELHGWWIPHPQARGSVVHCHGNAGTMGDRAWMAADLHRLSVNVFLFDYRGYGESKGLPTENGTYADARAAYEVVRARYDDREDPPIVVHGQSLGGAVAIQLALDKRPRGLIVESAFTSVLDMGRKRYPWLPIRVLIRYRYDSRSKVGHLTLPKLFCHSVDDELIPFEMGQQLYAAAAEPKEFVQVAGCHNEAGWSQSPGYWLAVERFINSVLK